MVAFYGGNCKTKLVLLLVIAGGLTTLLLSGCTDFRRALGVDRSMPDEFAVESRAPLTLPPDFDLRPPQPGAPRPQETPAAENARKAIDNAGPGEPGKQAAPALRAPQGGISDTRDQSGDQGVAH